MALKKVERRKKIKQRVRTRLSGTKDIPRMSVFRSNKHISVQIIDDIEGKTLVSASSRCKEVAEQKIENKLEQAKLVGKLISERSTKAGVQQVVFDRNGYLFHGRVKTLADAAREGGLKF